MADEARCSVVVSFGDLKMRLELVSCAIGRHDASLLA
jgi:hypothetical protein